MGRLGGNSERDRAGNSRTGATPGLRDTRTPSEARYFVLALAALIGLGIGWLAGKAITGSMHSTATTQAVAERAVPATFDGVNEASDADASMSDGSDSDEPCAPMAVVTQPPSDDSSARASHRAARRVTVRRAARGNPLLRPFKALRRFRIW